MKNIKYLEVVLHLLFWITPVVLTHHLGEELYIGQFNTKDNSLFIGTLYSTLFHCAIFYVCVYIILNRHRKSQLITFIQCFISFIIFTLLESVTDKLVCNLILFPGQKNSLINITVLNLVIHHFFLILAYTYGTIKLKVIVEKNEQKLKIEKLNAELNFLRMQTNPHFLFNTLNNLYGLARKEKAPATADGLTKLSKMMRYITYDSCVDYVPLDKEIENIQIYLELQKLRFSKEDDITISMETEGNFENRKIAPMMLIVLAENAFKHGIDIDKKSFIHIKISLIGDEIHFNIKNSTHKNANHLKEYSGIGLENIQKRLELLTSGKHNLVIKEENDSFTANLVLKL